MNPCRFLRALLPVALLLSSMAPAQNLSAIVTPPPEAVAVTQAAQRAIDAANKRVLQLDTAGLLAQLKAQPKTVVLDVRTPAELALSGHIDAPFFFNIARGLLEFQIEVACPTRPPHRRLLRRQPAQPAGRRHADPARLQERQELPRRLLQLEARRAAGAPARHGAGLLPLRPAQEVIPGVWSAIGATAPGTYENSGHNNNLSFVITDDGVLVVNAGDNYLLAQSLHEEIKKRTQQPVKYVVLETARATPCSARNTGRNRARPSSRSAIPRPTWKRPATTRWRSCAAARATRRSRPSSSCRTSSTTTNSS